MKSFLLLILSLTAGSEAESEVKGCEGGWVEFTCENSGTAHTRNIKMVIRYLECEDSGKSKCKFDQEDDSEDLRNSEPSYGSGEQKQEMELKVEEDGCLTAFNQTVYETAKTTITCDFTDKHNSHDKFICKEACKDNKSFKMSISNVNLQHGVYCCGVKLHEGTSCKKIQLEIKTSTPPPPTTTPTTPTTTSASTPTPSTTSAPTPTPSGSVNASTPPPTASGSVNGAVIPVVLLVLLLVIIVIFIYKRFSSSRNTRNGAAAQQVREDNAYEEVQERPQETGSGNAMKTIYATANFPTNPSDAMNYSTVTFQNSTDKADSEVLIHKPSSSACEYSTVKNSQSPVYSTVNKPSKTSEDAVNKTQQQ